MTIGANSLTSRATRPAPTGPPTSALQFRAFAEAFRRLGYDVDRLLIDIGCPMSELANPDGQIPCEVCGALFARTQQLRPLKNMWAHLGAETPVGAFKLLDYLVNTTDTVGEAGRQLARYFKITGAPCTVEILDDEDPVRMLFLVNGTAQKQSAEYGVALNVSRIRSETNGLARIDHVSFVHQPDDVADLEQLFGCEVRVNGSWAGLALPREAMKVPLLRRDPILRELLEQQADPLATAMPDVDGGALAVRRALAARLTKGQTDIDVVARDLGTSSRTLQRRLASAGLSYQELLDEVRRDTAERYIAKTTLSIGEIGYLLGYSEPAAFHRAFKRWHEVTPQVFREQRKGRD
jgi:AraC-like DNA-binding protein